MSAQRRQVVVLVGPQRIEEGLRMASALPLADNEVVVVLTGEALPVSEEIATHLDTLELTEVPVLATFADPRVTTMDRREIAGRIRSCDHVLTF